MLVGLSLAWLGLGEVWFCSGLLAAMLPASMRWNFKALTSVVIYLGLASFLKFEMLLVDVVVRGVWYRS